MAINHFFQQAITLCSKRILTKHQAPSSQEQEAGQEQAQNNCRYSQFFHHRLPGRLYPTACSTKEGAVRSFS